MKLSVKNEHITSLVGFTGSVLILLLAVSTALAPFVSPVYLFASFLYSIFAYIKLHFLKKWFRLIVVLLGVSFAAWGISFVLYLIGGSGFAPHSDVLIIYLDIHRWIIIGAAFIAFVTYYLYETQKIWVLLFLQSVLLFTAFYLREDMFTFLHPWQNTIIISFLFLCQVLMLKKSISRFFYAALALLLLVFTLSGVFAIVPAVAKGNTRKGGGLLEPSALNYRFSSSVDLEPEIELPDSLLLLYKREGLSNGELLKHRSMSLYTPGEGFTVHPFDLKSPIPDPRNAAYNFRSRKYEKGDGITVYSYRERLQQEMYFLQLEQEIIYRPEILSLSEILLEDSTSFSWSYQLESQISNAMSFHLRLILDPNEGLSSEELEVYSNFHGSKVIADMAMEITKDVHEDGTKDRYDVANAINNYLLTNYYYSLKPGPTPADTRLEYFLTEGKKGYCSYFAMSMVLMLRSLGIPARLVTGFYVDPDSRILDYYPIRANLAHAWVEVYFGKAGWIEFDPTSQVLAPGEFMRFDSLYQEDDAIKKLIEEILKGKRILSSLDMNDTDSDYGLLLVLLFVGGLFSMYQLIFRLYVHFPFWSPAGRKKAMAQYLVLKSKCFNMGTKYGETLSQWAERVEHPDVITFIAIYDEMRFGRHKDELSFYKSWKAAMRVFTPGLDTRLWWILLPGIRRPF